LSDLRESGAIEQDAMVGCLLHKPSREEEEAAGRGAGSAAGESVDCQAAQRADGRHSFNVPQVVHALESARNSATKMCRVKIADEMLVSAMTSFMVAAVVHVAGRPRAFGVGRARLPAAIAHVGLQRQQTGLSDRASERGRHM